VTPSREKTSPASLAEWLAAWRTCDTRVAVSRIGADGPSTGSSAAHVTPR
jgi:hypothetical protein